MEQKILVVDDEQRMRKLVKDFLVRENFTVLEAADGEEAVDVFLAEKDIDLIILDVMMPKMDGWQVCREIRQYSKVPIIMLTAKGGVRDRIEGLNAGADYYLTKPFDNRELLACINALLRRQGAQVDVLSYGNTCLDLTGYTLSAVGSVRLSSREFDVMRLLMHNRHGRGRDDHRHRR